MSGTWNKKNDIKLSPGGWIEDDSFYHTSLGITYIVSYRYAGNGIIAYDYHIVDVNFDLDVNIALMCVGLGAGAGMLGGLFLNWSRWSLNAYCIFG